MGQSLAPFAVSDALSLAQVFAPALHAARLSAQEPASIAVSSELAGGLLSLPAPTMPRLAGLIIEQRRLLDRLQAISGQREPAADAIPPRLRSPDEIVAAIAYATLEPGIVAMPAEPVSAPQPDAERPPMIIERAIAERAITERAITERDRSGSVALAIIGAEPPLYSVPSFLVGLSLAILLSFALYLGLRPV